MFLLKFMLLLFLFFNMHNSYASIWGEEEDNDNFLNYSDHLIEGDAAKKKS